MKFHKLEIEGFGPFKTKQTVDFSKFSEDGQSLFLIEGKTGAGKSSILDAITYALYNFTARWESVKANDKHKSVRSRFCDPKDPTRVSLEFSIPFGASTRKFRIERGISGLDKNGNEPKQKVTLEELFADKPPKGLAAQSEAVGREIIKLLGLNSTEFLQVVLLAQGKFEAFLAADTEKRLELLRKLFNTSRFQKVQKNLEERTKRLKGELSGAQNDLNIQITGLSQSLKLSPPSLGGEIEWLRSLAEKHVRSVSSLKDELQLTKDAVAKAAIEVTQARTKQEFEGLKASKAELAKKEARQKKIEKQLELAEKAARVEGLYDSFIEAGTTLTNADKDLKDFEGEFALPKDKVKLKGILVSTTKKHTELEALIPAEKGLVSSVKNLEELINKHEELSEQLLEGENNLSSLTNERDELKKSIVAIDDFRVARDESASNLLKFSEYETVQNTLDLAVNDHKASVEKANTYSGVHAKIQLSYLSNQAGALASTLVEGVECPVCGSTEHRNKAKPSKDGGSVTQLEFEASLEALQKFRDFEIQAKTAVDRLSIEYEPLEALFSKTKRSTLEAINTKAESAYVKATTAASRKERIDEQLSPDSSFMVKLNEMRLSVSSLTNEIESSKKSVNEQETLLKNNFGAFDSIESHYENLSLKIAEINEVSELVSELETASLAFGKSRTKFEAKRAEQGFADDEHFTDSLFEEDDFDVLSEEVSGYKEETSRVSSLLGQDRFKVIPKSTLPMSRAQELALEANAASENAQGKYAVASDQEEQISRCLKEAKKLVPKIGTKQKEYETSQRLAMSLNGTNPPNLMQMSVETYFAATELESILGAANGHLASMDAGNKIVLVHSDKALKKSGQTGLGVNILDKDSQAIGYTETLSGGEKFQVSLAIALGLAQVVSERSGAVKIDTLFVDEGFGTLDEDVLRMAMVTLRGLKNGGRTIGLISHVAEMKEIPAKLHVDKTPHGPSQIRQVVI